jgi:hypothetical protein
MFSSDRNMLLVWEQKICLHCMQRFILIHFPLPNTPEIKITKLRYLGDLEGQSPLLIILFSNSHGLVSSMCCIIIFLEIPILPFFSCQLLEEGIKYVGHEEI